MYQAVVCLYEINEYAQLLAFCHLLILKSDLSLHRR
jgi:hypothetical protein